jgi:hypothetical protein
MPRLHTHTKRQMSPEFAGLGIRCSNRIEYPRKASAECRYEWGQCALRRYHIMSPSAMGICKRFNTLQRRLVGCVEFWNLN